MAAAEGESLAALAAAKGLFFGVGTQSHLLMPGTAYGDLVLREADVLVPEWELKWGAIERAPGQRDYTAPDAIASHGRRMRGHTLLWHSQLPDWFTPDLQTPEGWTSYVEPHLRATLAHYGDRLMHWDVANEVIEPNDGRKDSLRDSPFLRMRGPGYIGEAFSLAREAAPGTKLYLNDYGLCMAVDWHERRRNAMLDLLGRLRADGVPVDGIGLQAHLDASYPFDATRFARFLADIAGLGLEITLTELDVMEAPHRGKSDVVRDAAIAGIVADVLAIALDQPATKGVVVWGLGQRHSWLRDQPQYRDNRGLPYDDDLRPTLMRAALADAFRSAPSRT